MDEKIRAKRTAIERATPDARECALQKLKSEKVTYKSMEKVELVQDFKNLNSSPPSQDTLLSAKALKEKNMRDVIAQNEQAERSRFAGVLDAEEKRWSTEKEGNLHSFLSTLQYVCTFSLIFIYHSGVLSCELTCEDI